MRKQPVIVYALLAVGAAAVIAGCGGGGSSSTAPGVPAGGPGAGSQETVSLTLRIPQSTAAQSRRAQYISAATLSGTVTVTAAGASPGSPNVVFNTTGSSSKCASGTGGVSCTVAVTANVGLNTFTLNLYDGTGGQGNLLSSASVQQTIVFAQPNTVNMILNGVPASISVAVAVPSAGVPGGFATSLPLNVTVKDASGAAIIGLYSTPVTLTNADTSGSTIVKVGGTAGAPLNGSTDVATLVYQPTDVNGGVPSPSVSLQPGQTQIGATATGVASPSVTAGTFTYIADRFFAFNHARTLSGTASTTTTLYTNGSPQPAPTNVFSYATVLTITHHAPAPASSPCAATFSDFQETYVYTQTAPAPTASAEVVTFDRCRRWVPNGTVGWFFQQNQEFSNGNNAGAGNSPVTGSVPGNVLLSTTYNGTGFQIDALPHTSSATWQNAGGQTQVGSGAQNSTFTLTSSGFPSFTQSSPSPITWSFNADGTATSTFSGGTNILNQIVLAVPVVTPSPVIPAVKSQVSPAPSPIGTFNAVDWYPNLPPTGPAVSSPQPYPVGYAAWPQPPAAPWNLGFTQTQGPVPASCGPYASSLPLSNQSYILANLQTAMRIVSNGQAGQIRQRNQTQYFVYGVGVVCEIYTEIQTNYPLAQSVGSGVISTQSVITWTLGVQSSNNL